MSRAKRGGTPPVEGKRLFCTALDGMCEKTSVVTKQRKEFVKMTPDMKAPAKPCRGCGTDIPEQPSSAGRPREFCTRRCRRDFHHAQEQASIERERVEEKERLTLEHESRVYGPRQAKRWAKERARRREEL
jgi:hypothetical protein